MALSSPRARLSPPTFPTYAIVGGNPGRVVRERFDSASVQRLLEIAWWDRPAEWIGRRLDLIRGGDVDGFCRISKPPIADQVTYGAQTLDESI